MNNVTKCLVIVLCSLALEQRIMTSFLFHDGNTLRDIYLYELPELSQTKPEQLAKDATLIYADPNSQFATEARVVNIALSPSGNQWMVSSAVIQNAENKVFNNLPDAQAFALTRLKPNAPIIERVRAKVRPQDRLKWRRT